MANKNLKIKYKPEYANSLINWFKEAPFYKIEIRKVYLKKTDKVEDVEEKVAASCPSFVRFADEYGFTVGCLEKWRDEFLEFAEAYKKAKLYQEEWLMNAAGLGFYNSSMSIMALKANHGWVEKQDSKSKFDMELKQVLVRFVKESELKKGGVFEKDNSKDTGDFCSVDDEEIQD